MEVIKKDLEEQYQSLSNKRLEGIACDGTHSATAVEVAVAELRSRGVQIASTVGSVSDEVAGEAADEPVALPSDVDLKAVYKTDNIFQANVVRNLLEAEGVFAYVRGANLGVAHLFLSIAGGDMRVEVREDQLAQANEVIAKYERGEYKLESDGEG